jgi:hypothetical protein
VNVVTYFLAHVFMRYMSKVVGYQWGKRFDILVDIEEILFKLVRAKHKIKMCACVRACVYDVIFYHRINLKQTLFFLLFFFKAHSMTLDEKEFHYKQNKHISSLYTNIIYVFFINRKLTRLQWAHFNIKFFKY